MARLLVASILYPQNAPKEVLTAADGSMLVDRREKFHYAGRCPPLDRLRHGEMKQVRSLVRRGTAAICVQLPFESQSRIFASSLARGRAIEALDSAQVEGTGTAAFRSRSSAPATPSPISRRSPTPRRSGARTNPIPPNGSRRSGSTHCSRAKPRSSRPRQPAGRHPAALPAPRTGAQDRR